MAVMSDIVERLRHLGVFGGSPSLLTEAADEIERLRAALQTHEIAWLHWLPIMDVCDNLDADTVEAALTFVIDSYRPGDLRERMADWKPRAER